jgi:hypothetical protein
MKLAAQAMTVSHNRAVGGFTIATSSSARSEAQAAHKYIASLACPAQSHQGRKPHDGKPHPESDFKPCWQSSTSSRVGQLTLLTRDVTLSCAHQRACEHQVHAQILQMQSFRNFQIKAR